MGVSASDNTVRFGGQVSFANYHVDDPDGSTKDTAAGAFGALATYDLTRTSRLVGGITRHSYKLDGSTTELGQKVQTRTYELSYQSLWRLARDFKPWFGAGLAYASNEYRDRFRCTTSTCAYGAYLSDRKTTEYSLLLNSNVEWPVSSALDLGLRLQFAQSLSTQSRNLGISVYLLY
jgi:hypothetical protein